MMRLLNICVIGALVLAAAYVYKIKFESTRQAERVAKLRMEIRREHDAIAALRAQWAKLDNPLRIEELAQRHLKLKSVEATQFDRLDLLMEWVENRKAPPQHLTVTAGDRSLPLCSYPAYPKYERGPTASVASYSCAR